MTEDKFAIEKALCDAIAGESGTRFLFSPPWYGWHYDGHETDPSVIHIEGKGWTVATRSHLLGVYQENWPRSDFGEALATLEKLFAESPIPLAEKPKRRI